MRRSPSGFTLIELMIVLVVGSIALTGLYAGLLHWQRTKFLHQIGQDSEEVRVATQSYISRTYSILIDASTSSPANVCYVVNRAVEPDPAWLLNVARIGNKFIDEGFGDPSSMEDQAAYNKCKFSGTARSPTSRENPHYYDCTDHQCVMITAQDLMDSGFIPQGWRGRSGMGGDYKIYVRRIGTPGNYNLNAWIVTPQISSAVDTSMDDFISSALVAREGASADAGVVVRATDKNGSFYVDDASVGKLIVRGFKATWELSSNDIDAWKFETSPITAEGQIVLRAGYLSSTWAAYLPIDGSRPMTGALNMGGNIIRNLSKYDWGKPCDGSNDPTSAASKALDGSLGTIRPAALAENTPNSGNYLGSGYPMKCGFDRSANGYIWGKVSGGVNTIEDAQSGIMDLFVTDNKMACWDNKPAVDGVMPSDFSMNVSGIFDLVFMMWGGDAWAYALEFHTKTYHLMNAPKPPGTPMFGKAGGFDVGYDWSWLNPALTKYPIPVKTPAGYVCLQPGSDPNLYATSSWSFSPSGVKFEAQGTLRVPSTDVLSNTVENYADIPVVVTTDSCSGGGVDNSGNPIPVSCAPISKTVYTSGRTRGSMVDIQVDKSPHWGFQRKPKCNIGAPPSPPPTSILASCIL